METIYFPAGGFGFWYLLGKYEHIREKQSQYILSGSSAGSIICLCSLVDFGEHNFFEMIVKLALEVLGEYKQRTYYINMYLLVDLFISKLFSHIDETSEKTKEQLERLRIQTTVFHPPFWFEKRQTTPTSLAHLRELCLASCYIPLVANCGNRLTYIINGERPVLLCIIAIMIAMPRISNTIGYSKIWDN